MKCRDWDYFNFFPCFIQYKNELLRFILYKLVFLRETFTDHLGIKTKQSVRLFYKHITYLNRMKGLDKVPVFIQFEKFKLISVSMIGNEDVAFNAKLWIAKRIIQSVSIAISESEIRIWKLHAIL